MYHLRATKGGVRLVSKTFNNVTDLNNAMNNYTELGYEVFVRKVG